MPESLPNYDQWKTTSPYDQPDESWCQICELPFEDEDCPHVSPDEFTADDARLEKWERERDW